MPNNISVSKLYLFNHTFSYFKGYIWCNSIISPTFKIHFAIYGMLPRYINNLMQLIYTPVFLLTTQKQFDLELKNFSLLDRSWITAHHHIKVSKQMCVKRSERRLAETYEQLRRGNIKPDIHSDLARWVAILVRKKRIFIELLQFREYEITSDSL